MSYWVGVCGGSASGKTRLLRAMREALPEAAFISQDNYYKPLEEQIPDADGRINFDHPDAVDMARFEADLKRLMAGETVVVREYHFNRPQAPETYLTYRPAPVIIVEGLFIYYYKPVADLFDLKLFVEADEHTKLIRRIRRDAIERALPLETILEQYERDVIPMYKKFVEPYRSDCDLILPNNRDTAGIRVVVNHLRTIIDAAR
ncbi:MAG: uridine-cytidine kinase [Bacteroidia bacterium]|nr:uridine-cytidine kinase [Bacteroidia bacterium]MDW8332908.1 uridine-cytidine kinase [Bacteroidia bacterium]